jgi:hypothetical protein
MKLAISGLANALSEIDQPLISLIGRRGLLQVLHQVYGTVVECGSHLGPS